MDAAMHLVRESFDTGRPVYTSRDLAITEHGSVNYHCEEYGTLLIRDAGEVLPDIIVICSVCLSLNETTQSSVPLPRH